MGINHCGSIENRKTGKNFNIDNDFINSALEIHNEFRKNHNAEPLKLNNELIVKAKNYAKILINSSDNFSIFTFNKKPLGENIYINNSKINPKDICKKWYKESKKYNYNSKKFQKDTLHFTQLIWKGTSEFGFGYISSENKTCAVALYYPPGNIFNKFDENIEKPK